MIRAASSNTWKHQTCFLQIFQDVIKAKGLPHHRLHKFLRSHFQCEPRECVHMAPVLKSMKEGSKGEQDIWQVSS